MEPPESQTVAAGVEESGERGGEIEIEIEEAKKLIMRWDSMASEEGRERMIFDGDRLEVDEYLWAVDEIRPSMDSSSLSDASSSDGDPATTIQIAMARLEDEFRDILISHCSPVETDSLSNANSFSVSGSARYDPDFNDAEDDNEEDEDPREVSAGGGDGSASHRLSTNSIREIDLVPADAISDLRTIAGRMISAGYLRECIQVYGSVRKSVVDASFRHLGIEKLSVSDVRRLEWDALEPKIRRWIQAAKICVRILFASEKRLCERIFDDLSPDADDACFMETVKDAAIQLFNFSEAISISRRSPEKLFKILDFHDAISDLLPDVAAVFRSKSSESVRVQAAEILSRLAEAARGILSEFENAVQREQSKTPVPGGTIHPLTRYGMNYLNLIAEYKPTLVDLIVAKPSAVAAATPEIEFPDLDDSSALAHHMAWIIIALESSLDCESKLYKESALAHLFIMNNVHYIVQKIKGFPELREMIGDDYLKKLTGKFRQSATRYQRSTWVRILNCLRAEGIYVSGGFSSGVSKTALRERFKNFNSSFEEARRIQSTWSVPDPQLREELRISIAEKLLPAYRSFLGRFRHHLESSRHSEMYIKYAVEDLESAMLDFFEACQVPQHIRRNYC